jgi:hypothetical protein
MAFPDELLAEELTRRGWTCTPPAPAKTPQRPAAPPVEQELERDAS